MSMTSVNSAQASIPYKGNDNTATKFPDFMIGQAINIKVQRRIDEQNYVVLIRGNSTQVKSEHPLPVGATLDAVVVATADKLELRQVPSNADLGSESEQKAQSIVRLDQLDLNDPSSVIAQAGFYKCVLTDTELATLQAAAVAASDPSSMMLTGLFLNKRGITIESASLHQLYALVTAANKTKSNLDEAQLSDANGMQLSVGNLAQLFQSTLQGMASVRSTQVDGGIESKMTEQIMPDQLANSIGVAAALVNSEKQVANDADGNGDAKHQLLELLNQVDTDGHGVRYGTVPVLVDGKLVELELVLFQHRQRDTDIEPIRRLVMSINTSNLGTVSITAEALNNNLLININAETATQIDALSDYSAEVRELAGRFGWNVDSVRYEVQANGATLARRVIEHTVRQGAVDNVW